MKNEKFICPKCEKESEQIMEYSWFEDDEICSNCYQILMDKLIDEAIDKELDVRQHERKIWRK